MRTFLSSLQSVIQVNYGVVAYIWMIKVESSLYVHQCCNSVHGLGWRCRDLSKLHLELRDHGVWSTSCSNPQTLNHHEAALITSNQKGSDSAMCICTCTTPYLPMDEQLGNKRVRKPTTHMNEELFPNVFDRCALVFNNGICTCAAVWIIR